MGVQVWHKQDDTFKTPKAYMGFIISSPCAYLDPHSCNLTYLFADLVKVRVAFEDVAHRLISLCTGLVDGVFVRRGAGWRVLQRAEHGQWHPAHNLGSSYLYVVCCL